MVPLRVLSRTNLAGFSPFISSISFSSFRLRTLKLSCRSFSDSRPLFSTTSALFLQNTRGGTPLRDLVRCTEAQKCLSVSPLLTTLTHSLSRKSFPCHSYANTRDRGATVAPNLSSNLLSDFSRRSPHATRHSPLTLTTFRINTCKSVSKQMTLTPFRINTYEKQGEGGLQRPASSIQPPEPYAPRNAPIPCALIRLRILPVTTGVYPSLLPPKISRCALCLCGSPSFTHYPRRRREGCAGRGRGWRRLRRRW